MSAYVVSNETISSIISVLATASIMPDVLVDSFGVTADQLNKSAVARQSLGQRLLDLNVASVNARYCDDNSCDPYQPDAVNRVKPLQAVKTIECYMYQSCEGGHDKDELYLGLEKVLHGLALDIVSKLPGYDDCKWG